MLSFKYMRTVYSLIWLSCWLATPAYGASVYFNDFQGAVGGEWSHGAIASAPNPDYEGNRLFLGEFGNDTVSLSLSGLPAHAQLSLSFDLYLIRSWDGNDTLYGSDDWQVNVGGGPVLFNTTFSNGNPAGQAYAPNPFSSGCTGYALSYPSGTYNPMTGASECYSLGYSFYDALNDKFEPGMDSVYSLGFTFAHSASSLTLNFTGSGLQGLADESWGLDNVRLDVAAVPIPAAVWLFGSGLLGLIGIARRKFM